MPVARQYCSRLTGPKFRVAAIGRSVAMASLCLLLAGCNKLSLNAASLGLTSAPKQITQKTANPNKNNSIAEVNTKTRSSISTFDGSVSGKASEAEKSARCRYLDAEAGIQRSILHTPTLSSEIDDEGDSSVSIMYDVVDIRRSRLKEQMAEARCRHHLASTKLVQMLITSSQSLTQAGYLAKADSLKRSSPEFDVIRRRIDNAVGDGKLTRVHASGLKQYITKVKSYEASARSQAVRREAIGVIQKHDTRNIDKELVAAQRDIEQLQSQIRTADLLTVSVSGGYNQSNQDRLISNPTSNDDFYGNVKVSMRLGAISPSRREWEEIAEQSRIDGLYETNSGLLWRSADLARIHKKALENLIEQRNQIQIALNEARRNSRLEFSDLQTELTAPKIRAQIDVLALKADLAGHDATIADSIRLKQKLEFK